MRVWGQLKTLFKFEESRNIYSSKVCKVISGSKTISDMWVDSNANVWIDVIVEGMKREPSFSGDSSKKIFFKEEKLEKKEVGMEVSVFDIPEIWKRREQFEKMLEKVKKVGKSFGKTKISIDEDLKAKSPIDVSEDNSSMITFRNPVNSKVDFPIEVICEKIKRRLSSLWGKEGQNVVKLTHPLKAKSPIDVKSGFPPKINVWIEENSNEYGSIRERTELSLKLISWIILFWNA